MLEEQDRKTLTIKIIKHKDNLSVHVRMRSSIDPWQFADKTHWLVVIQHVPSKWPPKHCEGR